MEYLYDPHTHTAEVSPCGRIGAQEEAVDESIAMNEKAGEHTIPEKFARQAEGAADD